MSEMNAYMNLTSSMKPTWRPVTNDAPKGLSLGPLLFNIFLNDPQKNADDKTREFDG